MTNNQKRSLYESIMKDVAKTVKRHLNEDDVRKDFFGRSRNFDLYHPSFMSLYKDWDESEFIDNDNEEYSSMELHRLWEMFLRFIRILRCLKTFGEEDLSYDVRYLCVDYMS